MCIIVIKPAGVALPKKETLQNCFQNNPDGAGYMFADNGKVHIHKGFFTFDSFYKHLTDTIGNGIESLPLVMHFRISTAGGVNAQNCHPFPISKNVADVQKTDCICNIGVAHNGIISIVPRKGISDTMEFVVSELAYIRKMQADFYNNDHALTLIENIIESKLAILAGDGTIKTIGSFTDADGCQYSNASYSYRKYSRFYDDDEYYFNDGYRYAGAYSASNYALPANTKSRYNNNDYSSYEFEELRPLDIGDFTEDYEGRLSGTQTEKNGLKKYWMDSKNVVYEAVNQTYAIRMPYRKAYDATGKAKKYSMLNKAETSCFEFWAGQGVTKSKVKKEVKKEIKKDAPVGDEVEGGDAKQ